MDTAHLKSKLTSFILIIAIVFTSLSFPCWADLDLMGGQDRKIIPQTNPQTWQKATKTRPSEGGGARRRKKDEIGEPADEIRTAEQLTAPAKMTRFFCWAEIVKESNMRRIFNTQSNNHLIYQA